MNSARNKRVQERVCVRKSLQIGIRASSTLAWYKNRGRKNDEVVYNFEQVLSLYTSRHHGISQDRSTTAEKPVTLHKEENLLIRLFS